MDKVQAKEQDKESPRLQTNRFEAADFTLGRFDAKSEVGIGKKDILNPEYWSFVSERMTPYSEITLRCDDGTYFAKLLVLDCGRGWAKVQILHWYPLTTADVAMSQSKPGGKDDYTIEYKGPNRKHVVMRKSDQKVLEEGFARKDAAEGWLTDFLAGKARVANPETQPG